MIALAAERLVLRPWRDDGLPAFARLNDDAEVMRLMPRRLPPDESDGGAARIRDLEHHPISSLR